MLFLVVVFSPLAALLAAWAAGAGEGPAAGAAPFFGARRLGVFLHTAGLAVAVAVAGSVLGTLAATALWRRERLWGLPWQWLLLAWAAIPPQVQALAWMSAVQAANGWLTARGWRELPGAGWWATAWVQLMAWLPLAVGLSWLGLASVDRRLLDAARVQRSEGAVYLRVALPLALPAILAGAGLLFLLSLLDYGIPSLYGVTVYSLDVFAEYSASNNAVRALGSALPLMLLTAGVVLVSQAAFRNAASTPARAKAVPPSPRADAAWLVWLPRAGLALLALQMAVPVVALVSSAGLGADLWKTLVLARGELFFSLKVALAAALLSLPLAWVAADRMAQGGWAGRVSWLLVTLPLAVPPPLVGIGLITLWNRPGLSGLYGTAAMPVLAALARFLPLAALVLLTQRRRVDPLLWDAAKVFQSSAWHGWLHVRIPLLTPGLLAAGSLVFALTLGELGATLLVTPPGANTLAIRIYNFLHYGGSAQVARLCLALAVLAAAAGVVAAAALRRGVVRGNGGHA